MIFYQKNGILKMRSDSKIDAPDLDCIEIQTTLDEEAKLKQNIPCTIQDGQLVFDEPVVKNLPGIKAMVEKAETVDDLKSIIQLLVK